MKKHCVRILSTFFGLAALAITAKGQAADQIVVNIPYEFVVAGKTLPAGTYRVNRVRVNDEKALVISSFESHAAVLVLSSEITDIPRYCRLTTRFAAATTLPATKPYFSINSSGAPDSA